MNTKKSRATTKEGGTYLPKYLVIWTKVILYFASFPSLTEAKWGECKYFVRILVNVLMK